MSGRRVLWVACPGCGHRWPWPDVELSVEPDKVEVDYTCPTCLHAEVGALKRRVAALTTAMENARDE